MITKLRLEAEGKTLKELVAAVDKAIRQLGPPTDDLSVHDEHYERIHDTLFKGRVVLGNGPRPGVSVNWPISQISSTSGGLYTKAHNPTQGGNK